LPDPAILSNVDGSTRVPTYAWNNTKRGTWGLAPPEKLESGQIITTLLMWQKNPTATKKLIDIT
jgi:hypothetical protein